MISAHSTMIVPSSVRMIIPSHNFLGELHGNAEPGDRFGSKSPTQERYGIEHEQLFSPPNRREPFLEVHFRSVRFPDLSCVASQAEHCHTT